MACGKITAFRWRYPGPAGQPGKAINQQVRLLGCINPKYGPEAGGCSIPTYRTSTTTRRQNLCMPGYVLKYEGLTWVCFLKKLLK